MKLRHWTPEEKMAIVLEGIKSQKSVAEICREYIRSVKPDKSTSCQFEFGTS